MRHDIDRGRWQDVGALREQALEVTADAGNAFLRRVEFACYAVAAAAIHVCLVVPALIVRYVTDVLLGKGIFQAARPLKRADLY